ncbi:hypothetical protein FHETE_10657 [Fusarium heterosporum]|uniref:Uncharacterized protein n=1 Tax=Fusarium heterosporum TaxID=42747 RepID=A0A8H5SUD8_FUSHE|nr:hypothetical protein FHETE_10657 [Fusarium heterosporum]
MDTTFTSVHGVMQLPPMDARITPPPEELNVFISKLQTCPILPLSPISLPDTPYPETPLISSSSQRKKRRRRSSSSKGGSSKTNSKQQTQVNSNLLFSPRPFESLYIERAYLATSLQQRADQAAQLMRQHCMVESQLQNFAGDNGRRKLRKQLSLLKSRINQAAEQERAIFSRLGELYVEIQSRETWAQAWTVDSPSVSTPLYFSPTSCSFLTPTSPIGGTSADFTPMSYFGDFHQVSEPAYSQEPSMYGLETVDEAGEDLPYDPISCDQSVEAETTPATPVAVGVPFAKKKDCGSELGKGLDDDRCMAVRERRLSLPCLHNAWPEV